MRPPHTNFTKQRKRAHRSSSDGQDSKSTCRISFRTAEAGGVSWVPKRRVLLLLGLVPSTIFRISFGGRGPAEDCGV